MSAMFVFWGLTACAFLVWLAVATGLFQAGAWINLLLVVAVAFAVTGLLFRPARR